ncbi:penicillin-binding transpeptidase domain-containing protein [Streptomyces sp. ODS28]|uniref:penicillin-binding transpeptidase domain-containing protein n=1 Tax=Streptomyces sp. ODS28 TaxID=3136688 RepID=UPI0031E72F0A
MRDSQKMAVIGGVAAAIVGATGFGVYALVGGGDKNGEGSGGSVSTAAEGKTGEEVPSGPPSAAEVRSTAQQFLSSWASGNTAKAAGLTDDRAAAAKALTGFRQSGHIAKVNLKPGTASGTKVPFSVAANISYQQERAGLQYASALNVVRDKQSGKPVVHWKPSVLHPKLQAGQSIKTDEAGTPPIKAVDRNGSEIDKKSHPTLGPVLDDLRRRYGDKTDGKPGVETRIVNAKGKDAGTTLRTLSEGTPGTLKTTLDLKTQTAAEKAVKAKGKGSAVAVKPSTGEILAAVDQPAGGYSTALRGSLAPGSTMKIVTAEMLMDKGMTAPNKQHPCPKYVTVGGWKFQNLNKSEIKHGTFAQSFAASCNNAFISQAKKLKDDDLTKEAKEVFGLGANWNVGTGTFDGAVPVQSDAQMAASLIGQGGVRANPLTMASVAATVQNGGFKQPVVVSPKLDDRAIAKQARQMKPGVAKNLKSLMKLTAQSGTGAKAMAGLSGDIGAKTGSAEVDGQKKPNAWFTAYRNDIASAAIVPASGHGGDNAGPVVRAILQSGGGS